MNVKERAAHALALKNNPLFTDILKSVKDRIFREWAGTNEDDVVVRERLYAEFLAAGRIAGEIQSCIDDEAQQEYREMLKQKEYGIA